MLPPALPDPATGWRQTREADVDAADLKVFEAASR